MHACNFGCGSTRIFRANMLCLCVCICVPMCTRVCVCALWWGGRLHHPRRNIFIHVQTARARPHLWQALGRSVARWCGKCRRLFGISIRAYLRSTRVCVCVRVCQQELRPAAAPLRSGSARARSCSPEMCDIVVAHTDTQHTPKHMHAFVHTCMMQVHLINSIILCLRTSAAAP